jgi:hypothetical protein
MVPVGTVPQLYALVSRVFSRSGGVTTKHLSVIVKGTFSIIIFIFTFLQKALVRALLS